MKAPPLTYSEGIVLDRARSAAEALDLALAGNNRAGVVLARQKLERLEASMMAHRRPLPEAIEIVADALARAEQIGGLPCR